MKPSQVLSRAARVIQQRGHYKGEYEGPNGAVCVFGAIRVAAGLDTVGDSIDPVEEGRYLEKAIGVKHRGRGEGVDWNDAPERTAKEVIAALKRASKLAAEESK